MSNPAGIDAGDVLQFAGGLSGALVAIGLWLAERGREHSRERNAKVEARRDFRSVVVYSVEDLLKQVNYIRIAFGSFVSDYEKLQTIKPKAGTRVESGFLSLVLSKATEFPIDIPSVLNFSLEHARFLAPSENGSLAEILTSVRSLNAQIWELSTSPSVSALGERLDIVATSSNLLYSRTEEFRAALEDSDVAVWGRVKRSL